MWCDHLTTKQNETWKTFTRVLSGSALMPINSSNVFCTTINTVKPVRNSSISMANGYTKFRWIAVELRSLSNSLRSALIWRSLSCKSSHSKSLQMMVASFDMVPSVIALFRWFLWFKQMLLVSNFWLRFRRNVWVSEPNAFGMVFISQYLDGCNDEVKFVDNFGNIVWLYCRFSILRKTLASSKYDAWYSSFTSRIKCGLTSTWPTTPNKRIKPNGVHTKKNK